MSIFLHILPANRKVLTGFMITFFLLIGWSPTALSRTFSAGYKEYSRGNFSQAEVLFSAALRRSGSPAAKAKIFKYLGVTQYMRGKKSAAAASFRKAKGLNPSLTLASNEVLDESVLPFFRAQKAGRPARKPSGRSGGQAGKPYYGKPTKNTTLVVKSNARNATIMIDGILAGNAGAPLEVQPGVTSLTVKARGYRSKNFRIRVMKNRQNTFTLNLSKIKPKPKPKPRPRRAPAAAVVATRKKKPPRKSAGDDLFADDEVQYRKPKRRSNDLVRECEGESSTPGYGQPAPAPAPVPGYPYGYPAYPAPYVAPVPAYPAYQPPYAAPPPAYQQPAPAPATPNYHSAPKRRKKTKRKKSTGPGQEEKYVVALLPFGAGQYQNGDTLTGVFFTVTELASLYHYYARNKAAEDALSTAETVKNASSEEYTDEQKEDFLTESEKYINSQRQSADMGLYGFVALWAIGSTEAFISMPAPARKSRYRKPRYSLSKPMFTLPMAAARTLPATGRIYKMDQQLRFGVRWDATTHAWDPVMTWNLSLDL